MRKGLGFGVWGLGFKVWGLGFGVGVGVYMVPCAGCQGHEKDAGVARFRGGAVTCSRQVSESGVGGESAVEA
jgi:hypothetical protein